MVDLGLTLADPDFACSVRKFVPVHAAAPVEPQANVDDCPDCIDVGLEVRLAVNGLLD